MKSNLVVPAAVLTLKEKAALAYLVEKASIVVFSKSTPTLAVTRKLVDKGLVKRSRRIIKIKAYEAGVTRFVLTRKGKRKAELLTNTG